MRRGMRIARPGKSSRTANLKDLVFSTEMITLPINKQVPFSGVIPSGSWKPGTATSFDITLAHPFDYAPLFRAWFYMIDTSTSPNWTVMTHLKPAPGRTGGANGTGTGTGLRLEVSVTSKPNGTIVISIFYVDPLTSLVTVPPSDTVFSGYIYIFENKWTDFEGV